MLAANSVADLTDNYLSEPIILTFTTMTRPTVDKKLYDYVVENVDDLLAAISEAEARRIEQMLHISTLLADGESVSEAEDGLRQI